MQRLLFPLTIFLSALLLFSVQPMVAKTLLPTYGGTPAVWTICMLFFQLLLLVSYGYVWLLSQFKKPVIWRFIHTGLIALSLSTLPLMFHPKVGTGLPEWTILFNLISQLGLPLLVIGASAPLLQFAYSHTKQKGAADPYFLYVASNLGSLISLLLYPWVIERFIGLNYQFHLWSIGFALYLVLLLFVLYTARYQALAVQTRDKLPVHWKEPLFWIALSFIPCSLMLGVTLYISTDIAATPLFWVVPLALYLLSFVLTFNSKPLFSQNWIIKASLVSVPVTLFLLLFGINRVPAWQLILGNLLNFFIVALLCHAELYRRRPKAESLTLFYFCLALGGVVAGVFNGLIAPHIFNQVYEYPLILLLSVLVVPALKKIGRWWLFIGLSLPVLLVFIVQSHDTLLLQRSFYAVNKVQDKKGVHVFLSQSTVHGLQDMQELKPLNGFRSYYGAIQPVVEALKDRFGSMSVTVMGLGMGTMLCQFRDTDRVKAIEIDQQVIDIAKNTALFTYLRDCPPVTEIIKNDGRLALASLANASQKILILDAFNSDAIPVHLMTLEAFTLYKNKISEDGVILINLSNRHLQLLPVINAMGRSLEMMTLHLVHKGNAKMGQFDSEWALLTANQELAFAVMNSSSWRFVADDKQLLWTDDYSNIVPLFRGQFG